MVKDFKTLKVWQKAKDLSKLIYEIKFPVFETYATKTQIIKSANSIGANIAEGNGQLYIKKEIFFLNNALGSAAETRHWIVLSLDRGYISQEEYNNLESLLVEIIKMLYGCIMKLEMDVLKKNQGKLAGYR